MNDAEAFKLLDEYASLEKSDLVHRHALQVHIVQELWDAGYCIRVVDNKEQLCHRSNFEPVVRLTVL